MEKRNHYDRLDDYSQDSLRYTSMEETGHEILIMTIDIGDGRKDELLVKEDDDPQVLADNFCAKHRLGLEVKQALIEQIEQNLVCHGEDDISTLLSVNKSYDSRAKRSNLESVRSSVLVPSQNSPNSNKPTPPSFEEKSIKIEEPPKKNPSTYKSPLINNYGEKLYLKGLRFIENVNRKKQDFLHQRDELEMKDTTFKPKIISKSSDRTRVQEILLKKGKERQEHIEKKRGQRLAEELSACTFSPLICKNSDKRIKTTEENSPDRFIRLYENAKVTESKLKSLNEKLIKQQCPFVPDIKESKKSHTRPTRLNEKREKISQSRKAIEEYLMSKNTNKDPQTGQELFKPVTGRPPKGRETNSKNIGEYLYSKRSQSQEPKKPLLTLQSSKLSSQQSERILNRIKELRYRQIFEELKPNDHEKITPDGIKKSNLSPRTLNVLAPFLQEMENLNEKLNFVEFQESMEILMKVLRPDQRSIILKTSKQATPQKEPDFQPKINQSSILRPKSVENFYERNLRQQRWVKEKCEQEKKIKEKTEMSECTFKPKILKYPIDQNQSFDSIIGFEPFLPLSGSYFY